MDSPGRKVVEDVGVAQGVEVEARKVVPEGRVAPEERVGALAAGQAVEGVECWVGSLVVGAVEGAGVALRVAQEACEVVWAARAAQEPRVAVWAVAARAVVKEAAVGTHICIRPLPKKRYTQQYTMEEAQRYQD